MKFTSAVWFFLSLPLFMMTSSLWGWGTNNRADPFPLYTSNDPQEFLYTRHRQLLQGWPLDKADPERVSLSLTGFGQAADSARRACGGSVGLDPAQPTCVDIPIGDLDGRWNMLALLYGPLPQGQSLGPLLSEAFQVLFPGYQPGQINDNFAYDIDSCYTNPSMALFSNALKYRKFGVRWNFEARLIGDFGFQFQGGLADVKQTLTSRVDLTSSCSSLPVDCNGGSTSCNDLSFTGAEIKEYLMDVASDIAQELCIDICSFHTFSVEDLYFCLYWRHAHEINFKRDPSWARFLLTPFIRIAGSAPTGKSKDPAVIFSVPVTNNGHASINANVGINLDFTDTIEIGGEVAYSHFFARDVCNMHLPNSTYQSGIYPFGTNVNVQPGDTWYGAAKLNAYHFIDRLSFWGQWVIVSHTQDTVRLIDCDPAFITAKCPVTKWTVQFINAGFNYDCSPNISLGFVWQFPIKWENAYKSNTVLFSFIATF